MPTNKKGKVVQLPKKLKPRYSYTPGSEIEEELEEEITGVDHETKIADKAIDETLKKSGPGFGPEFVFRRGSDKRGHSITFTVRFPPWVSGIIAQVVERKSTPYKNVSELIRDGVYHRMMYWYERMGDFEDSMKDSLYQRAISEWVSDQEDFRLTFQEDIHKLRKLAFEYYGQHNTKEFDRLIRGVVQRANSLDDPHWSAAYLENVKQILQELHIPLDKYTK